MSMIMVIIDGRSNSKTDLETVDFTLSHDWASTASQGMIFIRLFELWLELFVMSQKLQNYIIKII